MKPSTLNNMKQSIALIALLFSLSACLGEFPRHDLADAPKGVTPVLEQATGLTPYKLQIGDTLDIKLTLNPELNDQVVVRPDGMISTGLVNDVPAYGRTPSELQKDLDSRYRDHLSQPHLSVIVRSFAPTRIYVTGEVNTPGEFIGVGPTLTLVQAIARAGGVKNSAQTDNIVIMRHGASNQSTALKADYNLAVTGNDPASDVRLAPYDVVYVPRTGVANVFLNYQQYIQQFVPASFGATYEINPIATVK